MQARAPGGHAGARAWKDSREDQGLQFTFQQGGGGQSTPLGGRTQSGRGGMPRDIIGTL